MVGRLPFPSIGPSMEANFSSNATDDDPFTLTSPLEDRIFGAILILFTLGFIGPYVVCLWVLGRDKEMGTLPCYRIMFHIGIADIVQGISNGIAGGMFSVLRSAPPQVNKRMGGVLEGAWMTYSIMVNLLAFNRFIQVCFSSWASQIFSHKRTTVLISLCWLYGFAAFVIYNTPWVNVIYYPEMYLWGYDINEPSVICGYVEEALDLLQLLCMIVWYLGILGRLKCQTQQLDSNTSRSQVSSKELRVVVQSLLICFLYFATCFGFFVVPQISGANRYVTLACDLIWLTNCGFTPLIYIAFNTKLRRKVLRLLGKEGQQWQTTVAPVRSAVSMTDMRQGSAAPSMRPVNGGWTNGLVTTSHK